MAQSAFNPSAKDLRVFGLLLPAFAAVVGLLAWRHWGLPAAVATWAIGGATAAIYWAVAPWRRAVYLGWMRAAWPIGWAISNLVLAAVYYLLVTPMGLAMRLLGRDPMQRRADRSADSHWVPHDPAGDARRYFRQF